MMHDLLEAYRGVAVPEVRGPATEDTAHLLHDHLDRKQQPRPAGQFPDPVPGVLHGPVRGPASEERDRPSIIAAAGHSNQPVVKSQKIEPLTTDLRVVPRSLI